MTLIVGCSRKALENRRGGIFPKFTPARVMKGTFRGQTREATRETQWITQVLTLRASLSNTPLSLVSGHFPNTAWPANSYLRPPQGYTETVMRGSRGGSKTRLGFSEAI